MATLTELTFKAMAKSLNIEEHSFLKWYGDRTTMTAIFRCYPPCPGPDLTLGLKPHTDVSVITFVLQEKEVEGLQILKDGQWFRILIVPHALLVNIGDQADVRT